MRRPGTSGKAGDAPCPGELFAHPDIGHRLVVVKHVRERAHVARALDVVLAAQRIHARGRLPQVAEEHLEIGAADDIVRAARVLGDAERVAEAGRLLGAENAGHLAQLFHRNAGDLGGALSSGYCLDDLPKPARSSRCGPR